MSNLTKQEAQKLYESGNDIFKEIALRCYPELEHREKTITDYGYLETGYWVGLYGSLIENGSGFLQETDVNIFPTYELAELCGQIIPQLTLWRDKYNGCELKELKEKNSWIIRDDLNIYSYNIWPAIVPFAPAFKSEEIAKQFIKDHKTLLKRYYELLYV